jgi:hypothetical protein
MALADMADWTNLSRLLAELLIGAHPERDNEELELRDLAARDIKRAAVNANALKSLGEIRSREPRPLINEFYDAIVIDPPWPMQKIDRVVRPNQAAVIDYPTMDIEAIKELDIPCAENCHV